mmetsp:Transcript_7565/g.23022  ORF Transcript_7565/g.23022 Transcript_7565/m.23022 type:complete len:366 (-) Transcript_7565:984-2081(-)
MRLVIGAQSHTARQSIAMLRQSGQCGDPSCMHFTAQSAHTQRCIHGRKACVRGLSRQMTHSLSSCDAVSPPVETVLPSIPSSRRASDTVARLGDARAGGAVTSGADPRLVVAGRSTLSSALCGSLDRSSLSSVGEGGPAACARSVCESFSSGGSAGCADDGTAASAPPTLPGHPPLGSVPPAAAARVLVRRRRRRLMTACGAAWASEELIVGSPNDANGCRPASHRSVTAYSGMVTRTKWHAVATPARVLAMAVRMNLRSARVAERRAQNTRLNAVSKRPTLSPKVKINIIRMTGRMTGQNRGSRNAAVKLTAAPINMLIGTPVGKTKDSISDAAFSPRTYKYAQDARVSQKCVFHSPYNCSMST